VFRVRRNCTLARSAVLVACVVLAIVPAWAGQASAAQPSADLSHLVVLGDSLSAGFQNFSLYDSDSVAPPGGQTHGFAALIAQQANANLHLPLITYPGIPPALILQNGQVMRAGETPGTRESTVQTFNLSVPGFNVFDVLFHSVNLSNIPPTDFEDPLAVEILDPSLPSGNTSPACGVYPLPTGEVLFSTAICAIELQPTTILLSAGSEDALQSVTLDIPPTPIEQFAWSYGLLLDALSHYTHAKIVVSNVPNVTDVPVLVSVQDFVTKCGSQPSGADADDYVVPSLAGPTFDLCTSYEIRSAARITQAQAAVRDYNIIIAATAARFGAVVVDVNTLFAGIAQQGYDVAGHHLTTQYRPDGLPGGIFSLDAVHPTNTGYAILANAFIDRMNSELHTSIPPVDIEAVAKTDPLIF
jgi:GDSL-like Lipase/Acylhydrolase